MLQLPVNFQRDIQEKNTNLFPVIIISNLTGDPDEASYPQEDAILLSTNIYNSVSGNTTLHFQPLLLNVPSLKESIDIDKRNYKISNMTISISNAEYDGQRFSEQAAGNSLINKEVRIFWVSPSVESIDPYDFEPSWFADNSAFEVYYGVIRKYEHDDEKVTLTLEDRSQSKLHTDLPIAKLGADDTVLDKYKNKPIPMVYGNVDRSPTVISLTSDKKHFQVMADSKTLATSELVTSQYKMEQNAKLFLYNDEVYWGIPVTSSDIFYMEDFPDMDMNSMLGNQYTDNGNYFEMQNISDYDESNVFVNTVTSNMGLGMIEAFLIRSPKASNEISTTVGDITYLDPATESVVQSHGYDKAEYFDDLTLLLDKDLSTKSSINLQSKPLDEVKAAFHFDEIGDSDIIACKTYLISKAFISCEFSHILSLHASNSSEYESIWDKAGIDAQNFVDHSDNNYQEVVNPTGYLYGYSLDFNNTQKSLDDTDWNIYKIGKNNNFLNKGTTDWDKVNKFNRIELQDRAYQITAHGGTPSGNEWGWGFPVDVNSFNPGIGLRQFDIYDFKILHKVILKNPLKNDYYADIVGRLEEPNAPQAINHIVANELFDPIHNQFPGYDYSADTDGLGGEMVTRNYATGEYDDWLYDFTIHEKINSKKLIEEIASASPFLPRFNNMGKWKFTTIGLVGGTVPSNSANHTIKNEDVISFTYKRTPVEDVFTKVEFHYNWDYAREKHQSKEVIDVIDIFGEDTYDFEYYGLKESYTNPLDVTETIHPDSTLVIDDERGKYIRDPETAVKFAEWTLSWQCNQHIIIKCRLPLKYLNLEIGDYCKFNELLGNGVLPYGINYKTNSTALNGGQTAYKNFLITKTNKTLEYVEIECIQMHGLIVDTILSRLVPCCTGDALTVYGCMDSTACNYDDTIGVNVDDGSCTYPDDFYDCNGDCMEEWIDECGVCGGGETNFLNCIECPEGEVVDCAGVCDGDAVVDCAGVCNGTAVMDECGTCNGAGAAFPCCPGESGEWFYTCSEEICDGVDCNACADPSAWNYDPELNAPPINVGLLPCLYATDFMVEGCPLEVNPYNPYDYSDNWNGVNIGNNVFDNEQDALNWFQTYYVEILDETMPPPVITETSAVCQWDTHNVKSVEVYMKTACSTQGGNTFLPECPNDVESLDGAEQWEWGWTYYEYIGTRTIEEIALGSSTQSPLTIRTDKIYPLMESGFPPNLEFKFILDFSDSGNPESVGATTLHSKVKYGWCGHDGGFADTGPSDGQTANFIEIENFNIDDTDLYPNRQVEIIHSFNFDDYFLYTEGLPEANDTQWWDQYGYGSNYDTGGHYGSRIIFDLHIFDSTTPDSNTELKWNMTCSPLGGNHWSNPPPLLIDILPSVINQADINSDGDFNVLDIVALAICAINQNCPTGVGDVNGDGDVNVIDIVALVNCVINQTCGDNNG